MERGAGSAPQPAAVLSVKEAVIESLLTLKAVTTAECFFFSISNCPPYRPLRNSTAVEGLKWLLKGQTLEANRLNLTLTLPFIHCFDMSTLVKLSNIFL